MPELFKHCKFTVCDKLPDQNERLRVYISDTLNFRITQDNPLTIEKENVTHQDCLELIETLKAKYEPEENDSIFMPNSERHCNQTLVLRTKKNEVSTKNESSDKTLSESNIQSDEACGSEDIKDIISKNISNQPSSSRLECMEISETSKKALVENLEHLLLGTSVITAPLSLISDVQVPQDLSTSAQKSCQICFDDRTNVHPTRCCRKLFCLECEMKLSVCPFCRCFLRIINGNQPDGSMNVDQISESADGYEGCPAWRIEYFFPSGKQKDHHPNPGKYYSSCLRVAYLPANDEGFAVLTLLRLSFIRRLTFTIGSSLTTNKEGAIAWNDIHHKTSLRIGTHGFPDPTYMRRVASELADKGVRFDTITDEEKRDLDDFRYHLQNFKHVYKM